MTSATSSFEPDTAPAKGSGQGKGAGVTSAPPEDGAGDPAASGDAVSSFLGWTKGRLGEERTEGILDTLVNALDTAAVKVGDLKDNPKASTTASKAQEWFGRHVGAGNAGNENATAGEKTDLFAKAADFISNAAGKIEAAGHKR